MKKIITVLLIAVLFTSVNIFFSANGIAQTDAQDKPPKKYEPLIGTWDAVSEMQERQFDFILTFTMKKDTLKGVWSSEFMVSDLKKIKFEKNKLTSDVVLDFGEQHFTIYISATLKDKKLTGTVGSEMGNIPFTATKRKPKKKG